MTGVTVRQAREGDIEAVAAFTRDTWAEADRADYLPDVFPEWVGSDGADQHTVVAERGGTRERDGTVVGCCQVVLLSDHEAWTQGMRVHPDHRGEGVAAAMDDACRSWARERGATVARNMVFSWNEAGLGTVRSVGYEPRTEFRWAHPDPAEPGVDRDDNLEVVADPGAAWSHWHRSDARAALDGLALDPTESWALSECTRERFRAAGADGAVAVRGPDGTRGAAFRVRAHDRERDGETTRWVEYGVGAWEDVPAARALFDALARDAGDRGADDVRVLIPETPRHVSDTAAAGVRVSDDPDFVFEADLTGR